MKVQGGDICETLDTPLVVEASSRIRSNAGRCSCKILYTTICGAQLNEIAAPRGPISFCRICSGTKGSASSSRSAPASRTSSRATRRAALAAKPRHPMRRRRRTAGAAKKLNAGWVTTFNEFAIVSENRLTPIRPTSTSKTAPLFGCAVTTAAGVINNDAEVKIGESVACSAWAASD